MRGRSVCLAFLLLASCTHRESDGARPDRFAVVTVRFEDDSSEWHYPWNIVAIDGRAIRPSRRAEVRPGRRTFSVGVPVDIVSSRGFETSFNVEAGRAYEIVKVRSVTASDLIYAAVFPGDAYVVREEGTRRIVVGIHPWSRMSRAKQFPRRSLD
jgi:hypothetical protein